MTSSAANAGTASARTAAAAIMRNESIDFLPSPENRAAPFYADANLSHSRKIGPTSIDKRGTGTLH